MELPLAKQLIDSIRWLTELEPYTAGNEVQARALLVSCHSLAEQATLLLDSLNDGDATRPVRVFDAFEGAESRVHCVGGDEVVTAADDEASVRVIADAMLSNEDVIDFLKKTVVHIEGTDPNPDNDPLGWLDDAA